MKAIVTGANGFLGKTLINSLIVKGYQIIALDVRFDDDLVANPKVICIDVSNKDIDYIKNNIPKLTYDCFFHFAWGGTSGPSRADYELQLNNVKLTCDYIKICSEIRCKKFIYASSINEIETYEYLQTDNVQPTGGYIYGTAKLAAHLMGETIAKLSNIDFIPVLITNIYGVGEKSERMIYSSIKKLIMKDHCSFTDGYQMYDFIYITDAINSIIEISKKGKAFNRYYIGSGEPKPLREFLLKMRDIVDSSADIGLGDLKFLGSNISYEQFDLKKVERDTGYKNKVSFEKGIKLTAEYIEKGEK